MIRTDFMHLEAVRYRALADRIKAEFSTVDDDTLRDTLEGLSTLTEMLEEVVRSALDDEAMATALRTRTELMNARLARFQSRSEKKRKLVNAIMGVAEISRLEAPEFSVHRSPGGEKLDIEPTAKVPDVYLVPQPPRVDRLALMAAIRRGEQVEGARLVWGEPYISVRVK